MLSAGPQKPSPHPLWTLIMRCIARRCLRVVGMGLLLALGLIIHLRHHQIQRPPHHAPFQPPDTRLVVHGEDVTQSAGELYPLLPFPDSPMQVPLPDDSQDATSRPWLAAVICAAGDIEHRMTIRSTWMRLYQDLPFDTRFVVANPGPRWTDIVAKENCTFGDMIVLDHLQEDDVTANTIKTLELYDWLIKQDRKYEFVTKLDTDLWLNARGFWDRFLLPRLSNETGTLRATVKRTVIGELYHSRRWDLVFPQGAMYTMTWDMVELLASLQSQFRVVTGEDMAVAVLMLKGGETANFVNFRGTEKFDYNDNDSRGDGTAWARTNSHPNSVNHALVGNDVVAVHQLKTEELWFKVGECFDEEGIKEMPPPTQAQHTPWLMRWFDFWDSMGVGDDYMSRLERIPDIFWSFKDGRWLCDNIWDLGRTRTGYSNP